MAAQGRTSRVAALAPVAVAALLAVGAWATPARVLAPRDVELTDVLMVPPPPPPPKVDKPAPRWSATGEKLASLREPWKGPAVDPNTPAVVVKPQLVNWEYVGLIESSSGERTAMISINGVQRFVGRGEVVPDPANPSQEIVCSEITAQQLTFKVGAEVLHLDRKPTPPVALAGAPGSSIPSEGAALAGSMGNVTTPGNPLPGAPGYPNPNEHPGVSPAPAGISRVLPPTQPGPVNPSGMPTRAPTRQPRPGAPTPVPPPATSPAPH